MIAEAISKEKERAKGKLPGISGGASGGDILFQEVCAALDISTKVYLVVPPSDYIPASVEGRGPMWVDRFKQLLERKQPDILGDSDGLPRWLRSKAAYRIWQRNPWILHNALDISKGNLTLIALWDGRVGNGPGGTEVMVERVRTYL